MTCNDPKCHSNFNLDPRALKNPHGSCEPKFLVAFRDPWSFGHVWLLRPRQQSQRKSPRNGHEQFDNRWNKRILLQPDASINIINTLSRFQTTYGYIFLVSNVKNLFFRHESAKTEFYWNVPPELPDRPLKPQTREWKWKWAVLHFCCWDPLSTKWSISLAETTPPHSFSHPLIHLQLSPSLSTLISMDEP